MTEKLKNPGFQKGERSTGLAAVAHPHPSTYIKMGRGGKVGSITPPSPSALGGRDYWRIGFMVKVMPTEEKPAPFKWIFLKEPFKTEEGARAGVRRVWASINKDYQLYEMAD